jgi:hypothetical protein
MLEEGQRRPLDVILLDNLRITIGEKDGFRVYTIA